MGFWGPVVVFICFFVVGTNSLSKAKLGILHTPENYWKKLETNLNGFNKQTSLQLVVWGSRYFFFVVRLRRKNFNEFWIVHLETWGEKWIQFSPGKTDENKEVDSQIACCNKQGICDMCAECTINTIESHERPKSPQALNSSHQLCSICFFALSLQLCYCVVPWLPWLQVILQLISWTRRWKSMEPKSSTPWVVWMQRVTQKNRENSDLVIYTPEN